jgi:hypothetical protein
MALIKNRIKGSSKVRVINAVRIFRVIMYLAQLGACAALIKMAFL